MKKSAILLLIAPSFLFAANQVISVSPQQKQFTVTLTGNPTTGYRWFLLHYNRNLIKAVSYHFTANTKLMGAPGKATFTFTPTAQAFAAPQSTTLQFEYVRSWMPNAATHKNITIRFSQ